MLEPLLWSGPVSLKDAQRASLAGQTVKVLSCTGNAIPPPLCAALAEGGLDAALERAGLETERVSLAGFSAGGSFMKRVLENPAARARVPMVYGADAAYMTDAIPAGFVAYGVEAVADPGKLMVFSASSYPNKNYPNGAETLKAIKAEIERRTGRAFGPSSFVWPLEPEEAWSLGNVHFASYGKRITHGEHATLLAPKMFSEQLPLLMDVAEIPPVVRDVGTGPSLFEMVLTAVLSGALTYTAIRLATAK